MATILSPAPPNSADKGINLQQMLQKIGAPLPREADQLQDLFIEVRNAVGWIDDETRRLKVDNADELMSLHKLRSQADSLGRLRGILKKIGNRNPNEQLRMTRNGNVKGGAHWLKRMVAPGVYRKQEAWARAEFKVEKATAGSVLPQINEGLSSVQKDLHKLEESLAEPLNTLGDYACYRRQLDLFADRIDAAYLKAAGRNGVAPKGRSNWFLTPSSGGEDRFARAPE